MFCSEFRDRTGQDFLCKNRGCFDLWFFVYEPKQNFKLYPLAPLLGFLKLARRLGVTALSYTQLNLISAQNPNYSVLQAILFQTLPRGLISQLYTTDHHHHLVGQATDRVITVWNVWMLEQKDGPTDGLTKRVM